MMTLQAERRQDRMSKLTDTQKMLICVLVDVLLVALVWIFAFTPLGDKCSDAENDIAALQSDIDRLQDLVDQKDSFIEKTQVLNADTDTIIDKYGAGNTPEKILMFLVDLSKESNMTIPSISFGEETNVTVLSDGTPLSEASSDSSSKVTVQLTALRTAATVMATRALMKAAATLTRRQTVTVTERLQTLRLRSIIFTITR